MAKIVRAYWFIGAFSCVDGDDALAATQTGRRCRDPLPIPEWRPAAFAPSHPEGETNGGLADSGSSCPLLGA
jgi:hypothetical protein